MLASNMMPNQEEYHWAKLYNDLWTRPHAILVALAGTGGTEGVACKIVEGVDRGQVKSGRKMDGIKDVPIFCLAWN